MAACLQPEVKVSGGAAAFSSTPFLSVAEERPVLLNTNLTEEEMEKRLAGRQCAHRSFQDILCHTLNRGLFIIQVPGDHTTIVRGAQLYLWTATL